MPMSRIGFVFQLFLASLVCVCAAPTWGQPVAPATDAQATAPPAERMVVRDVSVFVSDAFGGRLNRSGLFDSTLPRFAPTRRKGADSVDFSRATPIGLVTFQGEPGALIDVLLEIDKGTFLGAWPKAPRRRNRLLWADLELQTQIANEPTMPDGHWLAPLRDAPRLAALSGRSADRFLLYDAEFDRPNDLKLVVRDGGYGVLYFGKSAVHDVTLYKPVEGGWLTGTVDVIRGKVGDAAGEPAESEPAEPAEEPEATAVPSKHFTIKGQNPSEGEYSISLTVEAIVPKPRLSVREHTMDEDDGQVESGINMGFEQFSYNTPPDPANPLEAYEQIAAFIVQQASEQGTAELIWGAIEEAPKWDDEDGVAAVVAMSGEVLGRDGVLASWENKLAELGLGETETAHVLGILKSSALDDKQMTAVYRLDSADLDRMLPIEVVPAADRISRVALVILINADPDLAGRVEELIAQLGDPSWAKREEAHKRLLQIGQGAKKSLEAALNNSDMEIVYRAEQLFEAINNPSASR